MTADAASSIVERGRGRRSGTWRLKALALVCPLVLTAIVHGPSVRHGFMGDDRFLVLDNPQIVEGASWKQLLLSDYFNRDDRQGIGYYRPVVKASFRATYVLVGREPWLYHLTNVLAHGLAALALATLLLAWQGAWTALFAGAIFAVHPNSVEAVNIITARSDLFAALFSLAAMSCLVRSKGPGAWKWRAGAMLAALLALGSKESALLLAPLCTALLYARGGTLRSALSSALPLFAVEATFLAVRATFSDSAMMPNALAALPLWLKLASVLKVIASYLPSLALARPIVFLPRVPGGGEASVWLGLAICLASAGLIWQQRLRGNLAFALLLGAAGLAPALVLWLIHIPSSENELPMAERWLYLPTTAVAWLLALVLSRLRPPIAAALTGALALVLGTAAMARSGVYRSDTAYMAMFVEEAQSRGLSSLSPADRYVALLYEATLAKEAGDLNLALSRAQASVVEEPWLPDGWKQLADISYRMGRAPEAEAALRRLLSREFEDNPQGQARRRAFQNDTLIRMDRFPLFELLGKVLALQEKWPAAAAAFGQAAAIAKEGSRAESARRQQADCLSRAQP